MNSYTVTLEPTLYLFECRYYNPGKENDINTSSEPYQYRQTIGAVGTHLIFPMALTVITLFSVRLQQKLLIPEPIRQVKLRRNSPIVALTVPIAL